MKHKLLNAAVDFFEAYTPTEKLLVFVFMSDEIAKRDAAHVSYAPNKEISTRDLLPVFLCAILKKDYCLCLS